MTAILLTRPDADRAPGGDMLQLRETAAVLEEAGHSVLVVGAERAAEALSAGDTLHLWNVQRAWDWQDLPERAREVGARVFVTPLLHPVERYHRAGRRGADAIAARLVRDAEQFRGLRRGKGSAKDRANDVLTRADAVLLAHEREAELLREWSGVKVAGPVVPPALPVVEPGPLPALPGVGPLPDDFALCIGRIEPLKNPLAVLAAAQQLHLPMVFVGAMPRGRHLLHGRRFRARCQGTSRWVGELDAASVRAVLRRARVHVLGSWTEVLGRVSVEAALEGCAVVATDVGHLPDYLGRDTPGLFLAEPGDPGALVSALGRAWRFGRRPGGPLAERARELLWERVAPRLLAVYGEPAAR